MSASDKAGSKDTPTVTLEVRPQARILNRLGKEVYGAPKDLRQAPFDREKPQAEVSIGIQLDSHVNVAFRAIVAPRRGTEDGKGANARGPQLGLVGLKGRYDSVLGVHGCLLL